MSQPIPIPRDLKVGDILVLQDGRKAVACYGTYFIGHAPGSPKYEDGKLAAICNDLMFYVRQDGTTDDCQFPPVVRIIRAKPAKPKTDKDAAWLLRVVAKSVHASPATVRRVRAIAKRLNNGVKP